MKKNLLLIIFLIIFSILNITAQSNSFFIIGPSAGLNINMYKVNFPRCGDNVSCTFENAKGNTINAGISIERNYNNSDWSSILRILYNDFSANSTINSQVGNTQDISGEIVMLLTEEKLDLQVKALSLDLM